MLLMGVNLLKKKKKVQLLIFGISPKKSLIFSPQAVHIHTVLSIKFLKVKTKKRYWKKQINVEKKILNKQNL